MQLRATAGDPIFFSPADEAVYLAEGMDQVDGIGETVTQTLTNVGSILDEGPWPTDPAELERAIEDLIPDTSEHPRDVAVLSHAINFVRSVETPPDLRAAALRVIAGLELELMERTADGGATFSVTYAAPTAFRQTFTFDAQGNLAGESTVLVDGDPAMEVPPGTTVHQISYGPLLVVDSLEEP